MRLSLPSSAFAILIVLSLNGSSFDNNNSRRNPLLCNAFSTSSTTPLFFTSVKTSVKKNDKTPLFATIGLGPDQNEVKEEEKELVAGVDYEVPDHESFRTSRRSKIDEQADQWFGNLMGNENGVLGKLAQDSRERLLTPVPLMNEEPKSYDDEEWTPYVRTMLPWSPLVPAYGLEEYGLPIPRRNAEAWRHFDTVGMVQQDYSALPDGTGTEITFTEEQALAHKDTLIKKGGWLDDEECEGRLVYINGRFAPQLSKTRTGDEEGDESTVVQNLDSIESSSDEVKNYLSRLTDGFTDELAAPTPQLGGDDLTSFKTLSGPDHALGEPFSQFAINTQQGTACFAALNTMRTGAVAYIHNTKAISEEEEEEEDESSRKTPVVLVVNAVTSDGGVLKDGETPAESGVANHPRTLVIAEDKSRLSVVQSCVDLEETNTDSSKSSYRPKLYNGFTQFFIKAGANVTHSYLDESAGMVTPGVELNDNEIKDNDDGTKKPKPREIEAKRSEMKNTYLEAIDAHVLGDEGSYKGTMMSMGGHGRVRVCLSVSLYRPGSEAIVNGFSLCGGAQRTDMKTNIHHIAQGTVSRQTQKNMIGGRATGAFRGRIRVEQSAQQTDSEQLCRCILLSDKSRAWAVPSLEIIADDVTCAHGATVSDLSDEELFYLRSRGLDRTLARNLLMYAFACDISNNVEPAMLGRVDSKSGLQKRVIAKLQNLVPQGERAVKAEYQSI